MTGKITGISGPTVITDLKGLKMYERVFVGASRLTGEVVGIEQDRSTIQIYEDTHGLSVGEPVEGVGRPLTVKLGPGLLTGIFDGLQRPLKRLKEKTGPFIEFSGETGPLETGLRWDFHAAKKQGDTVLPGEALGYVTEGAFRHYVIYDKKRSGRIASIIDGEFTLSDPVASLENGTDIYAYYDWPVRVPRPFRRKLPPSKPLITGQRSIDFLFSIAKGGTAIFPGGFGTGKTILEQSIAKFADTDIVVYAGCGERGNEMAELIEEFEILKDPWTNRKLMTRTILCINTSNMPVAAREASIYTAVSMAEYYRDMGLNVLFLADSISRWAEALREISSSLEEMPGEEGYPTYLASRVSGFLERAGTVETVNGNTGSLSMILSVSPPGGDLTEPVTQACLRTTGAFLMLDTSLAHSRHFPAIDWFQSYTLYAGELMKHFRESVSSEWEKYQNECRIILQKEEELKEVAEIVGAEGLQDPDRLIMHIAQKIREDFLCQNAYSDDAFSPPEKTLSIIKEILGIYEAASRKLEEGKILEEILK